MSQWTEKESHTLERLRTMLKVAQSCKKWQKQMRNSKQRFNILKEWQATEKSYIQDLKIIERDIQKPLKTAKLITDEEERLLFPNIKAMINLSQDMSKQIEDTIKTYNPIKSLIGQKLIYFYKFFMIYREYCNNFMKAQEIVKELKKIPEATKIEEKLKMDFSSYTIKPVQRPPKYQLLLREYHKCLPRDHEDYKIVGQAIEKYHQVNELNNQSMDRQIRAETMITLDKKYGNVISNRTGREYLKEFTCRCLNFKCLIYAFNDMLLLIQKKSEDSEQIYKRLYLDYTSYISIKRHFKYYSNLVFICGVSKSAHLEFDTLADTEHFRDEIASIIQRLYKREEERKIRLMENQARRRNLAKFHVMKWFQQVSSKIVFKPKIQISVVSTMKSKDEAFYAVQFKIISPYQISQTILLTFSRITELQEYLRSKYKDFQYTKLSYIPEHIGLIEAAKNRAKIIEYRSFVIEEFLNFVFRNEDYYQSWKTLADQLGINYALFEFATTENFNCYCDHCVEMKDTQPAPYYMLLLRNFKQLQKSSGVFSEIQATTLGNANSKSDIFQTAPNSVSRKGRCSSQVFNIFNFIRSTDKQLLSNFAEKMHALEAEMGGINFSLFPSKSQPLKLSIKLKIYLLNIEQEYIELPLKEDQYVRSILEYVASNNSLETIFDWSLYLYDEGEYTRIGNDEKILDFIHKWRVDVELTEEQSSEESYIGAKMDHLKKWGEEFWGSKKGKLFLKKHLHFEHEVEVEACRNNKERYHFLINEVFGRIKYENLYLSDSDMVAMCSFFLIKNEFEKVKYWTVDNIDLTPLKELLPAFRQPCLKTNKFKEELLADIKRHYKELEQFQNSRNAIEIIYLKILHFLRNNEEWITKYFKLTTYHSELTNDVMVGVNYNYFTVARTNDRKNILTIELQRLKYKTSTYSLFVYEGEVTYRYDGREACTIRQLIETYLSYVRMFSSLN